MSVEFIPASPMPSVVARAAAPAGAAASYLVLSAAGVAEWTADLRHATAFA